MTSSSEEAAAAATPGRIITAGRYQIESIQKTEPHSYKTFKPNRR